MLANVWRFSSIASNARTIFIFDWVLKFDTIHYDWQIVLYNSKYYFTIPICNGHSLSLNWRINLALSPAPCPCEIPGYVKCNVDVAVFSNIHHVGFGPSLRDSHGNLLATIHGSIQCYPNLWYNWCWSVIIILPSLFKK